MEINIPVEKQPSLSNQSHGDTIKIQDSARINELSPLLSPSDSTTTLIPTSPTLSPDENIDPEAQHPSSPSNEPSPPTTWRETFYVVFIILSLFGAIVPKELEATGLDPLHFTQLTWYLVVVCMVVGPIFVKLVCLPLPLHHFQSFPKRSV